MNNTVLPQCVGAAVGTMIRGIMPVSCGVCGEPEPFAIDYKAREIRNAIAYRCKKCQALEYVSASAPVIVA